MTGLCHVPPRVWTLAKLATAHGWEVRIDPDQHSCEVGFSRGGDLVLLCWETVHGKARLWDASLDSLRDPPFPAVTIRLRDVPKILTGGVS